MLPMSYLTSSSAFQA
uniref:Uncharacterized protein n=1 Tax=Arundo donax TaxID=35708 RepID=A0A0A8Y5K4_ARUDO